MYMYARSLIYKQHGVKDRMAGVKIMQAAAEKGYGPALYWVGERYACGQDGFEKDLHKALDYFNSAAMKGFSEAEKKINALRREIKNSEQELEDARREASIKDKHGKYAAFYELCESGPEQILLAAMISEAELEVLNGRLIGVVLLAQQINILRYRVDFMINEKLVVEVDGKRYHDNDDSFFEDRVRDQDLLMNGYVTVRFSAKQVYRDAPDCARRIISLAETYECAFPE